MLIVVMIIGMLAVIAWPNYVKYRARAQVGTCINNLKQIEGAKAQWAFENRKNNTDVPQISDVTPFLQHGTTPECPAGGSYRPRRIARQATCTYYSTGHALSNLNQDEDPAED